MAIDAQVEGGGMAGGIEQVTAGLVYGLGAIDDPGVSEFAIVVSPGEFEWLEAYLGARQRLVPAPQASPPVSARIARSLGPMRRPARRVLTMGRKLTGRASAPATPLSPFEGFYESLGIDVLHFPHQRFIASSVPSIYSPHDLQHRHHPEFFTDEQIEYRDAVYAAGCRLARAVAVDAEWVKHDVIRAYAIPAAKVHVVRLAPPVALYEEIGAEVLTETSRDYDLPSRFALYPAQTWPHKNHLRLLDALALLHDRDELELMLVCTGRKNKFWPTIEARVRELGLEDHVRALGFVSPRTLRALYRLAEFVFLPSLFEGAGMPVLDAFAEGSPVACSDVTSLPEYGGDAVLLFDPFSVESIADAWKRMATDAALRAALRGRGSERVRTFTWERVARTYLALYRHVAGRSLSAEERELVAAT